MARTKRPYKNPVAIAAWDAKHAAREAGATPDAVAAAGAAAKGFGHSGGQFGPKRQMGDSPFRAVGQMGD